MNRLAQPYEVVPTRLNLKAVNDPDDGLPMVPVDWGFAITGHAAQGSERKHVVIIGQWMGGTTIEAKVGLWV